MTGAELGCDGEGFVMKASPLGGQMGIRKVKSVFVMKASPLGGRMGIRKVKSGFVMKASPLGG